MGKKRNKKERKEALSFILNNSIIIEKIITALGVDGELKDKTKKELVKDMIETYRHESRTNAFDISTFGPGKDEDIAPRASVKYGGASIRNDSYDDYFDGYSSDVDDEVKSESRKNRAFENIKKFIKK